MADAWIINGIPGAGKSTTLEHLLNAISVASILMAIACRNALCRVSSGAILFQEGFTPVIDYVLVNREHVEEYRQYLSGVVLRLMTLAPGVSVALARDQRRPEKTVAPR